MSTKEDVIIISKGQAVFVSEEQKKGKRISATMREFNMQLAPVKAVIAFPSFCCPQ